MSVSLSQPKQGESTKAYCADCARRRRRGALVTFTAKASADLSAWVNRHSKHGKRSDA